MLRILDPPPNHPSLWLDDRRPELNTTLTVAGFSTVHNKVPKKTSGLVRCVGYEGLDDGEALRVRGD